MDFLVTIEENGELSDPVFMTVWDLMIELTDRNPHVRLTMLQLAYTGHMRLGNTVVYWENMHTRS